MQCWLCHVETDRTDTHHVGMQAHGGTEGVTVELCPNCHDRLHAVARARASRDPNKRRSATFPPAQEARGQALLRGLALQQQAWLAAGKPGKQRLNLELDRTTIARLQHLKADSGRTNLADFCAELLTQWANARYR